MRCWPPAPPDTYILALEQYPDPGHLVGVKGGTEREPRECAVPPFHGSQPSGATADRKRPLEPSSSSSTAPAPKRHAGWDGTSPGHRSLRIENLTAGLQTLNIPPSSLPLTIQIGGASAQALPAGQTGAYDLPPGTPFTLRAGEGTQPFTVAFVLTLTGPTLPPGLSWDGGGTLAILPF